LKERERWRDIGRKEGGKMGRRALSKQLSSQACWCPPVIPALQRLR
jgi:hypothetical protein